MSKNFIILISFVILFGCTNRQARVEGEQELDSLDTYIGDSAAYNPAEYGKDLFGPYLSAKDYPNTPFFHEMVEAYNVSTFYNALCSVDDFNRRWENGEFALESLESADTDVITDKEIKKKAKLYIGLIKQVYSQGKDDPDTLLFQNAMNNLWELDSIICKKYTIKNYASISEKEYYSIFDYSDKLKELMPRLKDKVTNKNISTQEVKQNIKMLMEKIDKEQDFNRKCDLAQAYIDYVGFYNIDKSILEKILDDGRYSHRLFFLWRIWRCCYQLTDENCGMSTWSVIPNKLYNARRFTVAEATLRYLKDHTDDGIAINQFLVLGHQPNILRAGKNLLGNEAVTELHYLGLRTGEAN